MSARQRAHDTIIVTGAPKGYFREGIIDGTPKPGTVMQLKSATEPVGDIFTYEVYNRDADGNRPKGALWILLEDNLQGLTVDDAYESGKQGRLYCPVAGDLLLMRLADVSGTTTDSHAIGEILIIDDGTGLLIATTGSPENEPFVCMETLSGLTAEQLTLCEFSGF